MSGSKKLLRTRIAGFNHKPGAAEALMRMQPQTRLVLRPEPENKFDKNAIAVYTTAGLMLGYIPKVDNEQVLARIKDPEVDVRCVKTTSQFNGIDLIYEFHELGDPLA